MQDVRCVETARAYHFGERVLVEVDIVLPRSMRLDRAHDIGEGLQCRIEDLRDVERCFVHLDTNCRHLLEHKGDNV
jgi:divalent metal cation (Fe/Co/Zn/Cd) transporter